MSQNAADQEALSVAKGLTGAMGELSAEVGKLRKRSRRNLALIIFDICLTIIVAATVWIARHAQQDAILAQAQARAARAAAVVAKQNNLALCLASNVARQQQIDLWTYIVHISKPPPTAAQRQAQTAFLVRLHIIFAPRNCAHIVVPPHP